MSGLVLSPREAVSFGDLYQTATGLVASDMFSAPAVDQNALTVRMRISTDCVDRERMVIDQDGISTEYYVGNPVVLFGHGEQGIYIPVALSEDPSGVCTVWREDASTWAIAHHIKNDKISMQIFDAVVNKLLRASSVGVTPMPGGISVRTIGGERVPYVSNCWLNEWSYCAVPVNPQAIVKSYGKRSAIADQLLQESVLQCERASAILSHNRLNGEPIIEPIKKALLGLIPKGKPIVRGVSMKKATRAELRKMLKQDLLKAFKSKDEFDEESKSAIDDEVASRVSDESGEGGDDMSKSAAPDVAADAKKDASVASDAMGSDSGAPEPDGDEMASDVDEDGDGAAGQEVAESTDGTGDDAPEIDAPGSTVKVDQSELPGSVAVRAGHDSLKAVLEVFVAEMAMVELPEYKEKIQSELNKITDALMVIAEVHDSQYPEAPSIAGGQIDKVAEMMKSLWKTNPRSSIQVNHLIRMLSVRSDQVAKGHFDRAALAKSLRESSSHLARIAEQAGSVEVVAKSEYDKLLGEIDRLRRVEKKAGLMMRLLDAPEAVR